MNKIIPATASIVILCSCSTEQIKTTEIAAPATADAAAKRVSAKRHHLADHPVLGKVTPFRHHTVLNVRKNGEFAADEDIEANDVQEEASGDESLLPRVVRYLKRGIASWYGPGFHGKKTANGEVFNMYAMTAAHNTLPIPSYAQVTNLENHRSVIVRINDRGPFVGNRLLDLSYAAAKKLDLHEEGTGAVEIKAIAAPGQSLPVLKKSTEKQESNVYLQVGSFGSEKKALKLKNKMAAHHLPQAKIKASKSKTATLYKVQFGPIKSSIGADKLHEQLAKLGITDMQIVTETKQN